MNHSRPNITDTLKKCYPFWEKLTDTQREQLKTSSYIRDYEPGSFVHSRSEECLGILIVLSGQLRTYIQSEEGREVTLFRLGPGEVCTLSAACMMQEITSSSSPPLLPPFSSPAPPASTVSWRQIYMRKTTFTARLRNVSPTSCGPWGSFSSPASTNVWPLTWQMNMSSWAPV